MKDKKQVLVNNLNSKDSKINSRNNANFGENELIKDLVKFSNSFISKLDKNNIFLKYLNENNFQIDKNDESYINKIIKTSNEIKDKLINFLSFIKGNISFDTLKENLNQNLKIQITKFIEAENFQAIKIQKSALKKNTIGFSNNKFDSVNFNNSNVDEYEKQLVKLEKDIRNQIKTEFELKLILENYQFRLNDLEEELNSANENKSSLLQQIEDKSKQIIVSISYIEAFEKEK